MSERFLVFIQYTALVIYIVAGLFAAVTAWARRERLHGLNKAKAGESDASIDEAPASFSRTVGLAGAISLTAFMWCIGLLLLAGHPLAGSGGGFPETLEKYILAGSALFAPYAFNQLAQIFPGRVAKSAQEARLPPDLAQPLKPPPRMI